MSGLREQYANVLSSTGRIDAALVQARRSADLDPLFAGRLGTLARIHLLAGNYDAAIGSAERALELNPATLQNAWIIAMVNHLRGTDEKALEAWIRYVPESFEAPMRRGFADGGWEQVNRVFIEVLAAQTGDPCFAPNPSIGAILYASAGDEDAMYLCLEQALPLFGDWGLALKLNPVWDPYRDAPRFTAVLERTNLAD
jgi:tetratricopeptide (TPR) repeat protein